MTHIYLILHFYCFITFHMYVGRSVSFPHFPYQYKSPLTKQGLQSFYIFHKFDVFFLGIDSNENICLGLSIPMLDPLREIPPILHCEA